MGSMPINTAKQDTITKDNLYAENGIFVAK